MNARWIFLLGLLALVPGYATLPFEQLRAYSEAYEEARGAGSLLTPKLIGNPGAYVPSPGAVAHVRSACRAPSVLPFGPDWLRGRIPLFFGSVIAFLFS